MMLSTVEERLWEDMTNRQTSWNTRFGVDEALHRGMPAEPK